MKNSVRDGLRLLQRARRQRIVKARTDVNVFVELVGIDTSKDGDDPVRMVQHPLHIQMQRDIDANRRVVFMSHPSSGKSSQLVLRAVWEIGRNPNIRIVVCSKNKNNDGTGAGIVRAIRDYMDDPLVREVFPHLARGPIWQDKQFIVKRSTIDNNPTVKLGAANDPIKGSRIDWLLLDDWYDEKSCDSPTERKKLLKWFWTVQDRLSEDAQVIACCNAIHPDDPGHHIEKLAIEKPEKFKWLVRRFPVYEPSDYDIDLSKVRLVSPAFFSRKRIEDLRNSIPQLEFQRLYLCNAIDEAGSVFDHQAVHRSFRPPTEPEGDGEEAFWELDLKTQLELGIQIVVGVDLAASERTTADKTCLTAVAYWPIEDVRQVVWVESGRWRSDIVAQKIIEFDRRFRPVSIIVETSGQQALMIGTIHLSVENERLRRDRDTIPTPPIKGFFTSKANKWHMTSGVESVSTEIIAGRWRFPAIETGGSGQLHSDLVQLKNALINYVRGNHTGDHLMSLWLANQGIRMIAYQEDDRRDELEIDRSIMQVQDLVYRYRPDGIDHTKDILNVDAALSAWEALRKAGVDLAPYHNDYTALMNEWLDPKDQNSNTDPYDIPDPELSWDAADAHPR